MKSYFIEHLNDNRRQTAIEISILIVMISNDCLFDHSSTIVLVSVDTIIEMFDSGRSCFDDALQRRAA
jgi:hypothetical protein